MTDAESEELLAFVAEDVWFDLRNVKTPECNDVCGDLLVLAFVDVESIVSENIVPCTHGPSSLSNFEQLSFFDDHRVCRHETSSLFYCLWFACAFWDELVFTLGVSLWNFWIVLDVLSYTYLRIYLFQVRKASLRAVFVFNNEF